MPRPIPADLEDALSAAPAARERFWSLPPERVDEWVGWVESARMPRTRRRRVAETVQRLNSRPQAAETVVQANGAGPAALPPRESPWLWFLAVALLILVAALIYFFAVRDRSNGGSASKVTVPRVIGLRKQAAQFELRQQNLTSTVVTRAAAKPQGIVVGQTPNSGSSVSRGTPVTLVVSTGAPGVALPNVVGLTAADATKQLQSLKLRPAAKPVASTKPAGTVLGQTPAAGAKAKPGSAVVLTVAQAKQTVAVPSVTGQTLQAATATLTQAGFSATVAQVPSKQPKGTVVAQRPAAGRKAAKGSGVRLNVSRGSSTATTTQQTTTTQQSTTTQQTTTTTQSGTQSSLPQAPPQGTGNDYRGMQLSKAVQQIADGRQQAVVLYVASSKPAGIVVSNGTVGSKMRLAVSAGPNPGAPTDLPDVSGEDAAQAQSDLQAAGFTPVTVQWPVSDPSQNGTIVEETPAGGAQRPTGVAIVLYVGTAP
jgi:beta-lactam-binding protein with PASTA domain